MPLNCADGLKMLRLLVPGLFIAGIFHPAHYNFENYIQLKKSDAGFTKDTLYTHYTYSFTEEIKIKDTEKQITKGISSLNCTVLKKIRTLTGASIHYAGTLPFSKTEQRFSVSPQGKLYNTKNVFVADGSGFMFLPGKGLTLSLMAYAHFVAEKTMQHE
jgi:choline dehydrogenase-like flavoprotein